MQTLGKGVIYWWRPTMTGGIDTPVHLILIIWADFSLRHFSRVHIGVPWPARITLCLPFSSSRLKLVSKHWTTFRAYIIMPGINTTWKVDCSLLQHIYSYPVTFVNRLGKLWVIKTPLDGVHLKVCFVHSSLVAAGNCGNVSPVCTPTAIGIGQQVNTEWDWHLEKYY